MCKNSFLLSHNNILHFYEIINHSIQSISIYQIIVIRKNIKILSLICTLTHINKNILFLINISSTVKLHKKKIYLLSKIIIIKIINKYFKYKKKKQIKILKWYNKPLGNIIINFQAPVHPPKMILTQNPNTIFLTTQN